MLYRGLCRSPTSAHPLLSTMKTKVLYSLIMISGLTTFGLHSGLSGVCSFLMTRISPPTLERLARQPTPARSAEHTSELQIRENHVVRLLQEARPTTDARSCVT